MAIENTTPVNPDKPTTVNEQELEQVLDITQRDGDFEILEDGSAVLQDDTEEMIDAGVDDNLADFIDESVLGRISGDLLASIEKDKSTRQDWEKTYTDGLKYLGMKFDDERSEPFSGASGVIHPLLGEAVTQFQAQAYKELLPANGPVKTQIIGEYNSSIESQAQRVREFMNYQIIHKMEEYDEELDQLLFYLPLAGSAFKKIYFDESLGRAVAKFVAPEDLIVPYYATELETCGRITNVIKMSENEVKKLQASGFYRDISLATGGDIENSSEVQEEIDKLSGQETSYDDTEVSVIYEVHTDLDLEGFEDINDNGPTGIKLPYIVTIDLGSGKILSIRRNFKADDPLKNKIEYFVHYKFLPGLGFYGFGLTHMIGGLSKASTSILRQLIDAGTLANLPAGFKTRGIRIRDEDTPIQPGEFRDVDAPGGSLSDSIQPLPFKEPSNTLLSLLGILVDSGQKFASIAEINVGQGNPSAPVGTTLALLERSTKVLSAIHKRLHNAQKKEFKLLSDLFKDYLPPEYPYQVEGGMNQIKAQDFDEKVDIMPISNPDIFSTSQRIAMAQEMMQLVQSNPEIHGPGGIYEAYRRMYAAIGIDNIDSILKPPPSDQPLPMDAGKENNMLLMGQPARAFKQQNHDAHIAAHTAILKTPPVQSNAMVQALIHAHIMEHLQMKADIMAEQSMPPEAQEQYQGLMAQAQNSTKEEAFAINSQATDILAGFSAPIFAELVTEFSQATSSPSDEDPLVALRRQEIALKGQELALENQQFQADQKRKIEDSLRRDQIDRERIDTQENIAVMKDETTKDRLEQQRDLKMLDLRNK